MLSLHQKPSYREVINKRLPRVKAVTIGVGIKCTDGIVLCADTQMTVSNLHKFYERKIHTIRLVNTSGWVCFTYAGDPELLEMFREKVSDIVGSNTYVASIPAVKRTITDVLEAMRDVVADSPSELHTLCGVSIEGHDLILIKTVNQIVHEVQSPYYDFVGVGDCSVVRYLNKILFQANSVTSNAATFLGTYLVAQAKAFIHGCGGETDIVILLPHGAINMKDRAISHSYEQQLLLVEHFLAVPISTLADPTRNNQQFDSEIQTFSRHLKELF